MPDCDELARVKMRGRKAERFRVLQPIYEKSDADPLVDVSAGELSAELKIPSRDLDKVIHYLSII